MGPYYLQWWAHLLRKSRKSAWYTTKEQYLLCISFLIAIHIIILIKSFDGFHLIQVSFPVKIVATPSKKLLLFAVQLNVMWRHFER